MNERKTPPRRAASGSAGASRTGEGARRRPQTAASSQPSRRSGSASADRRASGASARSRSGSTARPQSRDSAQTQQPRQRQSAGRSASGGRRPPRKKQKLRLRWGRILILLAVLAVVIAVAVFAVGKVTESRQEAQPIAQSVNTPLVSDADKAGFDANINSDSAILINADNGDVLYEKDADTQRAPASLVKMMTVYVAIRNNDSIDREVQIPDEAFEGLDEESASQSGLKKGETVTLRDLLYAALLASGGDAANALALITSGNIDAFVDLMNDEAANLGLDSTVFTNPTGLDDDDQVSTCRDMARLVKGALGNSTFREVFTTREYTTTANDTHAEGLTLSHTMDEDLASFQRYFDTSGYEIVGGKTGYTAAAGNCLATLAEKAGSPDYIVVTMHATGRGDQYYQAVHDAVTLYGEAYGRDSSTIETEDAGTAG